MVGKHRAAALLGLILITTIVILLYYQFQLREDPKVYSFTVETADLRIKDIEFVVYSNANSVYITSHDLERIGDDKQFSGVTYGISVGGTMILSLSQADDPFILPDSFQGKVNYNTRNLIQDVKAREHDTVNIELLYTVNGVAKNVTGTVNLSKIAKSISSSDNKNVIQL
ncbi:hypothetical protein [Paenibacillus vini]|uniref:Late embryogenesis abundant protein LEA-2 subgroup domain-containing protein n=1 Tax=Paenibacillus vini TaxID=1476024 RepID=A0ABQ4MBY7_9BACL|nr:hypothetical protein [Paenibacillus vini]GIP53495.1 hypothetical protein J42TS3_25300 [Paenibacillus vini]